MPTGGLPTLASPLPTNAHLAVTRVPRRFVLAGFVECVSAEASPAAASRSRLRSSSSLSESARERPSRRHSPGRSRKNVSPPV